MEASWRRLNTACSLIEPLGGLKSLEVVLEGVLELLEGLLEPHKTSWKRALPTLKTLKNHWFSLYFGDLAAFGSLARLGSVLEASEAVLEGLGGVLKRLEGVLEASWSVLEASWSVLDPSWRRLRASWSVL